MAIIGVVMAGGKGTRLRPITYSIPKPLVPIAGYPCIEYTIESFYRAGVKDIIVTTGYKFDSLISGVIDLKYPDLNVLFSVEKEPAGTAGGVKLTEHFIDGTFIVGSGDILSDFDIKEVLDFHRKKKSKVTIVLSEVDDPSQFGIVEMEDHRITKFLEKPKPEETFSKLVNAGIYVMEPSVLEKIPYGKPFDFGKDLFPLLLSEGEEIYGITGKGTWIDTGRPHDMIRANQIMTEKRGKKYSEEKLNGIMILKTPRGKISGNILGSSYIGKDVTISRECTVNASAIYDYGRLEENVIIEDSLLMDHVSVGKNTRIRNSVIMKNTQIGDDCDINDSVLSPNLNLHSGSKIYNVSLTSGTMEDSY